MPSWSKAIDADTQLAMSLQREIILEAREKANQQPTLREQFSAVSSGLFGSLSNTTTTMMSQKNKGPNQTPTITSSINESSSSSMKQMPKKSPSPSERSELPELPDLGLFKAMSVFGETAKKNLGTFGESTKKNLDSFSETAKKNLDSLVTTVSTASANVTNTVASSARSASLNFPSSLTGSASNSGKVNATSVGGGDNNESGSGCPSIPGNSGGSPHSVNNNTSSTLGDANKAASTPPSIPSKFASRQVTNVLPHVMTA